MNPVGKTFRYGPGSPPVQVIGLVKDGKHVSLTEAPNPVVFRPILQDYNSTTTYVIRSRTSAAVLVPQIQKEIATLDPRLPIYGTGSLEGMLGFAMFPMHAAALSLSAFGVLALLLTGGNPLSPSWHEIMGLASNSIGYAFVDNETKARLETRLIRELSEFEARMSRGDWRSQLNRSQQLSEFAIRYLGLGEK